MSTTDWTTYAAAAEQTGLSLRQLRRHVRAGAITTKRQGRYRLLRSADLAPYTPAAACEVVPVCVGEVTLQGLRFGEEEVIATRLIEEALGYDDGSLRDLIRRAWSDEFEEGTHYRLLGSSEMGALDRTLRRDDRQTVRLPSLHVLTEQGVALVLMKSGKEPAARLRVALAETGFMRAVARAVMAEDAQALTQTLAAPVPTALDTLALTLQQMQAASQEQSAAILALLQQQSARLDRLEQAPPRPAELPATQPAVSPPPSWGRCTLRAERIAQMLGQRLPKFRNNPSLVHQIARDLGLKGLYEEGKHGYAERRDDLGAYPVWLFSPAAVRMIEDQSRNLGHLDFGGRA